MLVYQRVHIQQWFSPKTAHIVQLYWTEDEKIEQLSDKVHWFHLNLSDRAATSGETCVDLRVKA